MVQTKTRCFTAARRKTLVVSSSTWKQQGTHAIKTGFVLFSNPFQYRYKIEETGETFISTKSNTKDAYEEYKFLKSSML